MGISQREFIRWLPDEASEPTATLVVTSPGRRFVDIRVLRPDGASDSWPEAEERVSLDRLDWAIAGTSSSWQIDDGPLSRGQWRHWIDSRTSNTEGLADEGVNYPQPDGKTLEKGKMINPATGKETDYEELWRDLQPIPVDSGSVKSVVLELEGPDGTRGMVVLLGQFCQGLLRRGDRISAERWDWAASSGWRRVFVIGDDALPCSALMTSENRIEGDIIRLGEDSWRVVESTSSNAS